MAKHTQVEETETLEGLEARELTPEELDNLAGAGGCAQGQHIRDGGVML
jgi:hypothetical protein